MLGAVADADSIDNYLRKDLNVPSDQICNLRNQQATRKEIIEALKGIANNDSIQRGDPILIYYAGHGGLTKAPVGWETESKEIQMLIPQDHNDIEGPKVYGIPDQTIGALINDVAEAKGDNIVWLLSINCNSS